MTYLLMLEGPLYSVPLKLFEKEADAIAWAKDNPAVLGGLVGDSAYKLVEKWRADEDTDLLFTNENQAANYEPYGYSLHRFNAYGEPHGYATLGSYNYREPGTKPYVPDESVLHYTND